MIAKFSFQDNSEFLHGISCSSNRIAVASVKTYETTKRYINLRLFKKDSEEFSFNQKNLSQLLNSILSARKQKRFKIYRLEELQRKINAGSEPVVKVVLKKDSSTKVAERKNHDKKLQIKQVTVTKKVYYQNGGCIG